jgi:hypothetical protein
MSTQRLHFFELKRRIANLEVQHNNLTAICTILAKQLKDLQLQKSNDKLQIDNKKSVEQLFKERLQSQKTEIREIDLNKKSHKVKKPVPESSEDENEDDEDVTIESDSDESEEEVKPVKAKKEIKAPKKEVVKAPKKAPVKAPKKEQVKSLVKSDSNIAVEIVDSMSK